MVLRAWHQNQARPYRLCGAALTCTVFRPPPIAIPAAEMPRGWPVRVTRLKDAEPVY
jgi:hypothetical protein